LIQAMRLMETADRLDRAATAIAAYQGRSGHFPDQLKDTELRAEELGDAWGFPLEYEWIESGARVFSLGPDHLRSRIREDPSLERSVGAAAATAGTPAARAICRPLPAVTDLPRVEVDQLLDHPETLAAQARFVPDFADGRVDGFRVLGIAAGSIHERIGLCNGDVVTTVLGFPLDSPDAALELYGRLKDTQEVTLTVRRGDQPGKITVHVR
jgi:hypothetical protein